jgi:iron complex transport system ATP-binding protein
MVTTSNAAEKFRTMIDIQNITIQKSKKTIVQNASFQIQKGQITVAIGRNGAGKSTLLEALTGRNLIQSGAILWDNKQLQTLDLKQLATRRAVLSQKVEITFSIRVSELVEMGCYACKTPLLQQKINTLVQHALKEVDMLKFQNRDFRTLSGGEQKRVLLAKAIVQLNCSNWANVNKYLFLDEPTASLDVEQQFKLLERVKKIVRRRDIGVFAVLHDINLAAQFADQILLMKNGEIIYKGSPKTILTTENLQETLGIQAIIQKHPIYDCPYVLTLPNSVKIFSANVASSSS